MTCRPACWKRKHAGRATIRVAIQAPGRAHEDITTRRADNTSGGGRPKSPITLPRVRDIGRAYFPCGCCIRRPPAEGRNATDRIRAQKNRVQFGAVNRFGMYMEILRLQRGRYRNGIGDASEKLMGGRIRGGLRPCQAFCFYYLFFGF